MNVVVVGDSSFSWALVDQLKDQIDGRLYFVLPDPEQAMEASLLGDIVAVRGDIIQAGQARNGDERGDAGAQLALQFEDDVGSARDDARRLTTFGQQSKRFVKRSWSMVVVPHSLRSCSSRRV